jgi:hypothetical protein|uniref:Uncharacterized protein n=1 Tax=Siphoviridae sp. ctfbh2 TaxID=2827909 RepID=A0A8S5T3L6_9CAUD|nr:MAG TPA: hypothetical protein [Siphoviridae sp. ctfbh2]
MIDAMNKAITRIVMPAIGLIGFVWFVFFFNPQKMRVRIGKVDKIEKVSGNKDGFHTDIHYMLYTDKGTFRINISGFVAHPELVGRIKIDSICTMEVCGIEVPFIGVYRNVVNIRY